jgi:hypothetical protein
VSNRRPADEAGQVGGAGYAGEMPTGRGVDRVPTDDEIEPGERIVPALRDAWAPRLTPSGQRLEFTADDLASAIGRPEVNVTDVYPLVLAGRGLHFTVKSVLDRVPCPGLVAVQVADMPAAVLVPVWRAAADNDGIHAFAAVASSLRRPND